MSDQQEPPGEAVPDETGAQPVAEQPADDATTTPPPMKRRGFIRRHWILTSLAVVLLLIVGTAGGYLYWANQQIAEIPRFELNRAENPKIDHKEGKEDLNILLLGVDNGGAKLSVAEDLEDGEWTPDMHNSDTMILLHIPEDRKSASMVSIPRDSWVKIDGYPENNGRAKINAAFSYGGPALALTTVEELTKVSIDHVAIIDWAGFKDLTTALGGVDVYIPETFYDDSQKITWPAGWNSLEGQKALQYVRTRHGLANGDFDRIARQQNFMRALMKSLLSSSTTTNPVKFTKVLSSVSNYLTVDDTWDTDEIRNLAWSMRGVRSNDITFFTAPVGGAAKRPSSLNPSGQDVLLLDKRDFKQMIKAMVDDKTDAYLADHPDSGLPGEKSVS
jgi:LCP family protein required for cell wall assembly